MVKDEHCHALVECLKVITHVRIERLEPLQEYHQQRRDHQLDRYLSPEKVLHVDQGQAENQAP